MACHDLSGADATAAIIATAGASRQVRVPLPHERAMVVPAMRRAGLRTGLVRKPRDGHGRCSSCGGRRDDTILAHVGSIMGIGNSIGIGRAAVPLARAFGALGLDGLAQEAAKVAAGGDESEAMQRATNIANILVLALRTVPAIDRKRTLSTATSLKFAQDSLALAAKMKLGLGLEDGLRFSFALHMLRGILESDAGMDTAAARVYRKVADDAKVGLARGQEKKRNAEAAAKKPGAGTALGDLGYAKNAAEKWWKANYKAFPGNLFPWELKNCSCWGGQGPNFDCGLPSSPTRFVSQVTYLDRIRQVYLNFKDVMNSDPSNAEIAAWGVKGTGCSDATLKASMTRIRDATGARRPLLPDDMARGIKHTGNVVTATMEAVGGGAMNLLDDAANWTQGILCKGFKAILPRAMGESLCMLFSMLIEVIKNQVVKVIQLVTAAIETVLQVIRILASDRTWEDKGKDAVMAILGFANKVIMYTVGPLLAMLTGTATKIVPQPGGPPRLVRLSSREVTAQYDDMARRLTEKAPFFFISLVSAVGNMTAPTVETILAFVSTCAPLISIVLTDVLAPVLRMAKAALEKIVDQVIAVTLMIVAGAIALKDIVNAWAQGVVGAGGDAKTTMTTEQAKEKIAHAWQGIKNAVWRMPPDVTALLAAITELLSVAGAASTDVKYVATQAQAPALTAKTWTAQYTAKLLDDLDSPMKQKLMSDLVVRYGPAETRAAAAKMAEVHKDVNVRAGMTAEVLNRIPVQDRSEFMRKLEPMLQ